MENFQKRNKSTGDFLVKKRLHAWQGRVTFYKWKK